MSLAAHLFVLGLLVIDLLFGGWMVDRLSGRWATVGFEFLLILGYVLFVLQVAPWARRDGSS